MIALYVVLFFLLQITFIAGLMNGSNRKMSRRYSRDVTQLPGDAAIVILFGLIPIVGPIGALFGSLIAYGGEFFGFSLNFSKQTFK
jgi:hypothetical protein